MVSFGSKSPEAEASLWNLMVLVPGLSLPLAFQRSGYCSMRYWRLSGHPVFQCKSIAVRVFLISTWHFLSDQPYRKLDIWMCSVYPLFSAFFRLVGRFAFASYVDIVFPERVTRPKTRHLIISFHLTSVRLSKWMT